MRLQNESVAPVNEALPVFDGFPYLSTRLVPGAYHIALLPFGSPRELLMEALWLQVEANRFDTALVLGPHEAVYLSPGGEPRHSSHVPRSSIVLLRCLLTVEPDESAFGAERAQRLEAFAATANAGRGYLLGDITKGGRVPSVFDWLRLAGRSGGVPRGLYRCRACEDFRGECLHTTVGIGPRVVPVHCRCDNITRCARCWQSLRERRVNGNHYDERDRTVWHWPGFMAAGHRCERAATGG